MEIKVFGLGCSRCAETEALVKQAVAAKGVQATVIKVSDPKEIMLAGIMSAPAVTIDGEIKCSGRIPAKEEILAWLDGAKGTVSGNSAPGGGCSCGGRC